MPENDLRDSHFSVDTTDEPKTFSSSLGIVFGVFFLGLVLGLPSGITAWFDGLPWTSEIETIVLSVIIPFLLILGWRFLALRLPVLLLGTLLIFKITLFFGSPSSGWLIKLHPNLSQEMSGAFQPFETAEGDSWVKTYATIWNEKASGILKKSWTDRLDFPMDWVLNNGHCGRPPLGAKCLEDLNPIVEIEGAVMIPKGRGFALVAEGVQEGDLAAINESGEELILSPSKSFKEAEQLQYQLPGDGRWRISGKLLYAGTNWSLIPVLVAANGEVSTDLGREVLWQNEQVNRVGFYKTLSLIADSGVIIFLLVWIAWIVRALIDRQIINRPFAVFSILAVCLPFLLKPVFTYILRSFGLSDPTKASHLGFSIIIASLGFLIWTYWKKDFKNFQADRIVPSVFLFFGPALLIFFASKWWPLIGQWFIWGVGDDWTQYQKFARKIVVEGEWLRAGEGVIVMMPLYRYFVGIYHLFFGQSPFTQHMADVWCVLGATTLISYWAVKFRLAGLTVFVGSIVYLTINLVGAFRYHIGRGLVEQHGMIFMVLAGFLLYWAREGGIYRVIFATLFGILGFWTRLDHLGAIAGLAFLAFEPIKGPTGGWKGYWDRLKLHWQRLAIYWGGGILSVLALCFRNWWLGGEFFLAGPVALGTTIHLGDSNYPMLPVWSFYEILAGNRWPHFPSISSIVLIAGTFAALTALVWRPKFLRDYPLSIGITLVGLFAPYAFIWVGAYPPRTSIHLLPFALFSFMYLVNIFFNHLKISWTKKAGP